MKQGRNEVCASCGSEITGFDLDIVDTITVCPDCRYEVRPIGSEQPEYGEDMKFKAVIQRVKTAYISVDVEADDPESACKRAEEIVKGDRDDDSFEGWETLTTLKSVKPVVE